MRAPPKFATDAWAWEYTCRKVEEKTGRDYEEWIGKDFGAAGAIYKRVIAKYGEGGTVEGALTIFVPERPIVIGSPLEVVLPGSAIVSAWFDDDEALIDFEGNAMSAPLLDDWGNRVRWAAERHRTRVKTSARLLVDRSEVFACGQVKENGEVITQYAAELQDWIESYRSTEVTA